jgi:DNA-binding MarR family transcriptional regulator
VKESDGLAEIERAMLVIRRRQGKRTLRDAVPVDHIDPAALTWIPTLEVIEEQTPLATVGGVATILGLDSSRVSRIVAAATAAGYVVRVASQDDGRSVHLVLTDAGQKFADYAHAFRREGIRRAMEDWPAIDRTRFVKLMTQFAHALDAE